MGEPGAAGGVVYGAGVDVGIEGEHGSVMALNEDEVEAIGERELGDLFLKILQALGRTLEGDGARQDGYEE